MKRKRVLVLGGYGLIGQSIVRNLIDAGHSVVALGRDADHGRRQEPRCDWIAADISWLTSPDQWTSMLHGVDAVVNASGALQSGLRDRLDDLQNRSIVALIEACRASQARTFVQVSAPGATGDASTEFMRTKSVADDRLRESGLAWVILKPGLVISPNAYGGTALLRMLAAFPFVLPLVHGQVPVGTVDIDDVAAAAVMGVEGTILPGTEMDIIETAPGSLEEVALAFRKWLGLPALVAVLRLPPWLGTCVGKAADMLGRMGWRSPLRSTALEVIKGGVTADNSEFVRQLGRAPRSLQETLHRIPATVQERWFAQLYLAIPVVIATLSLFWLVSGLVGFANLGQAAAHLTDAGFGAGSAKAIVAAGAAVDITLAIAVLFRPLASKALVGMAAVTAGYLLAGTVLSPSLWADPLGPYVKTVPAAVLALVASSFTGSR
ncbi:SDR family oxidoreductase [Pararhizobium sp. BT-229]|uniref:SDR family oxidoreductase n=1 Tax=Pararhizobium sp. BT-229 TaxID=2986923 RepID=UPI0021F7D7F7|nr:SDR family oxidoreductase [Pararhizobium sp. BT-229]MCV9964933.1 SDR family oxidoreductase [Pararhizobium sp. BT-229]